FFYVSGTCHPARLSPDRRGRADAEAVPSGRSPSPCARPPPSRQPRRRVIIMNKSDMDKNDQRTSMPDMIWLQDHLNRLPAAAVHLVIGQPGMGKSRLPLELAQERAGSLCLKTVKPRQRRK